MLRLKTVLIAALVAGAAGAPMPAAQAAPLTIYEIQHTTDPAGDSASNGMIVDCAGGIVTHKFGGSKPKITLQDPAFPDGWGGIQVKDWTAGLDLFNAVAVGDRVSLTNVEVEESYGNTLLHFKTGYAAGRSIESSGNALPPHKLLTPAEIAAPIQGPPDEWYVADHSAERYEAMRLKVEDVTVTAVDLGAKRDNYNLQGPGGDCWAADYMNADRVDLYHPYVSVGTHFDSVRGILEQYTRDEFDCYQLLTTQTADFVPEPASLAVLLAAASGPLAMARRRRRIAPPGGGIDR